MFILFLLVLLFAVVALKNDNLQYKVNYFLNVKRLCIFVVVALLVLINVVLIVFVVVDWCCICCCRC